MRVLAKVAVFPLVVILTIAGLIVRLFIKVGSMVSGVAVLLLGICAVLALINKMWLQLGIFGLIFLAMFVILFASAELQVWIDVATDRLKRV